MIFVTVGTQLPFDRLIRTIDVWASGKSYADAFAQIGPAKYRPKHIPWTEFLDADECRRKTEQADVVVAHAGMGSILTALEFGRPVLVMPRLSALGEHRNDHQLDTAKKLLAQGRIFVAFDENQLLEKLEYLSNLRASDRIATHASSALLDTLRTFICDGKVELPKIAPAVGAPIATHGRVNGSHHAGLNGTRHEGGSLRNRFGVTPTGRELTPSHEIKSRLVSVVLLAGRLRMTDLGQRISRSRLDLPIERDRTLLAYWRDEAARLAERWGCGNLSVRVLLDQASLTPTLPSGVPGITMSIERDRSEFRGTGGVLHDACDGYDDDDWVLVGNAAQIIFEPLCDLADRLAEAGGYINVVNEENGVPNGLILLRCGVLRTISEVGFHDMKEQIVPTVAGRQVVKVVPRNGSTSPPIHSLEDYTTALRRYYGRGKDKSGGNHPFDERCKSLFSVCEQGSSIAESAVIHDSVILEGAAVEKGAVVVRSVVGRGARVPAGQVIINQVVI